MPWGRLWKLSALVLGVLLAAALIATVPGSIATSEHPGSGPRWQVECARHQPRGDRILLRRCARVTGRVLVVRPEGTGEAFDIHLLVTARLHLFVVKLEPGVREPHVGAYVTVEGALVRARDGFREIDAWAVR